MTYIVDLSRELSAALELIHFATGDDIPAMICFKNVLKKAHRSELFHPRKAIKLLQHIAAAASAATATFAPSL